MSFDVAAEAYGAFMGRWSEPLGAMFADRLDLAPGLRALDVGCGPGALTAVLVDRLGEGQVVAVDPSGPFVAALHGRLPAVEVHLSAAEALPMPDDTFDAVAAQLVVHFMRDPQEGVREMARVARPGGVVGACVWDNAGGTGPLSLFWRAARSLDPDARDESERAGSREGDLERLLSAAGLVDVDGKVLTVRVPFADVDAWWEPFTLGVGPAGDHVESLDAAGRDDLRAACADLLPAPPFELAASAWCATGRVPR